ncbi:MAG: hypothetical protein HYV13_02160 [Candidatus Doudnabacteria bacterium]|nr:hypothetical protein [Candidatus Doudnabacteria bacterium]
MENELYSLEQAQREAEILQKKIKSGEASSYAEAERQLESTRVDTELGKDKNRRELVAERIESKLKRLRELMKRPSGQRFLHFTITYADKTDAFSEKFSDDLANIVQYGILSQEELIRRSIRVRESASFQSSDVVCTFRDNQDSYNPNVHFTEVVGTFVIDPDAVEDRLAARDTGGGLDEVNIYGVPKEAILGVILPDSGIFQKAYKDFTEHPERVAEFNKVMDTIRQFDELQYLDQPEALNEKNQQNPLLRNNALKLFMMGEPADFDFKIRLFLLMQESDPSYSSVRNFYERTRDYNPGWGLGWNDIHYIALAHKFAENPNFTIPVFKGSSVQTYSGFEWEEGKFEDKLVSYNT